MYWLVLGSLFWVHVFGQYHSQKECEEMAQSVGSWLTFERCLLAPERKEEATHEH